MLKWHNIYHDKDPLKTTGEAYAHISGVQDGFCNYVVEWHWIAMYRLWRSR